MEEPHAVKSKELFPAVFGRHALAYQQRIEQVMTRGEARAASQHAARLAQGH